MVSWSTLAVAATLLWVFYNFVRERFSPDLTVIIGVAFLLALGILTPKETLSVLSNNAPVTIAALFVISAALERTGCIAWLGDRLGQMAGTSVKSVLLPLMLAGFLISPFVNNTPIVIMLTPVAISLALSRGISPSKVLIPLSYATILGGLCTMVGTSTNILVDGVAQRAGLAPFSMFEISAPAIMMAVMGGLIMYFFAPRLLPERSTLAQQMAGFKTRTFMAQLFIPEDSPLIGKTLVEARLANGNSVGQVLKLFRDEEEISEPPPSTVLQKNDRLIVHTERSDILDFHHTVPVGTGQTRSDFETIQKRQVIVMEVIVGKASRYSNRPMKDLDIAARYGIHVIALHRKDANVESGLDDIEMEFGDVLLIEGTPNQIRRFCENGDLITLSTVHSESKRRNKAPIALLTMAGVMLMAALGVMSIEGLAMIGAVVVIATRCVDIEEAYKSIEWPILTLIFGMLALSIAMEKVGLVQVLADGIVWMSNGLHPVMILSIVFLITSLMTEAISNNAVAVLVTPVAIGVAQQMGLDPRPFVVAVMFAASASFATPIGYQTNTLVYNAGGYRFQDFMRLGIPMNLVVWITGSILIPLFWPLQPA